MPETSLCVLRQNTGPENIDRRTDRDAVLLATQKVARRWRPGADTTVFVELGNSLHREFWAAWTLMQELPQAQFICTIHDPPTLTSNPYRFHHTEFAGKTPFRLLDVALTKAAETSLKWCRKRTEALFIQRCRAFLSLTRLGKECLEQDRRFRGKPVFHLPHVRYPGQDGGSPGRGEKAPAKIVLFCFLAPNKGIETLLEAYRMLRERGEERPFPATPELCIFGGTADTPRVQKWLAAMRETIAASPWQDAIRFEPGFIDGEERDRRLAEADVWVLPFPSVPVVFCSTSAIRALGLGKAVVAARANTMPEMIQHGENGLLFEEGNVAALAACLEQMLRDGAGARKMGQAARERIDAGHSTQAIVERLSEVFVAVQNC